MTASRCLRIAGGSLDHHLLLRNLCGSSGMWAQVDEHNARGCKGSSLSLINCRVEPPKP